MRIYTFIFKNDDPDDDSHFTLFGSNDGDTVNVIANSLSTAVHFMEREGYNMDDITKVYPSEDPCFVVFDHKDMRGADYETALTEYNEKHKSKMEEDEDNGTED